MNKKPETPARKAPQGLTRGLTRGLTQEVPTPPHKPKGHAGTPGSVVPRPTTPLPVTPRPRPGNHEPPAKRSDEMPLISEFSRPDMDLARSLMVEYLENKETSDTIKDRQEYIKTELHRIGRTYDAPGMRWGTLVVYDRGEVSRPGCKLDAFIQKLVEDGMDLDVINQARTAATKDGKPFLDMTVKDLAKNDRDRDND